MKIILFYYSSELNKTLSYQQIWQKEFCKSENFETYGINLARPLYYNFFRFLTYLISKRNIKSIVLLHSVFSNNCNLKFIFRVIIRNLNLFKVYFIGNEYKLMPEKISFIRNLKINLLFTQSDSKEIRSHYMKNLNCNVEYSPNYILDKRIFNSQIPFKKRSIDIGYRAYANPLYIGHNERVEIANFFKIFALRNNLKADISLEHKDRLDNYGFARFLNNCKFQIGTEAGLDFFELNDKTRNEVNKYLEKNPEDWNTIKKLFFQKMPNNMKMRLITGRNIESCACGSVQILFEGNYSGYLLKDIHYIPLKKDFSNISEVIKKMKDKDYCMHIQKNCFELCRKEFSPSFVLDKIYFNIKKYL